MKDEKLHMMQRAFRATLDAFARPGSVHKIEPFSDEDPGHRMLDAHLETAVRLFVDQAVSFAMIDSEPEQAAVYLARETHAKKAAVPEADFVIIPSNAGSMREFEAISSAQAGDLASPEKGALVIMGVSRIADHSSLPETDAPSRSLSSSRAPKADDLMVFEVSGPGVAGSAQFALDRDAWAQARIARGDEFPCGVDILFVAADGAIVAIPRSSKVASVKSSIKAVD